MKRQPVFISFASEDEAVVRERIYDPLTAAGFSVFMYTESRQGGVIAANIRQALEQAGSLVFALSAHSSRADRDWLTIELSAFLLQHELGAVTAVNVGEIPPLQLETIPLQLAPLDILDLDGWLGRALSRLEQPPGRRAQPQPGPAPLPEWVAASWPLMEAITGSLPQELFYYPAPVIDELHAKLTRAGVVILRGAQLSGKSRLLRQLAARFPQGRRVQRIKPQDVKLDLQELFDTGRKTETLENELLLPLAIWASQAARSVLFQLSEEEGDRVRASPGGPFLSEYTHAGVALEDIAREIRKTTDGKGGPNEILAFQRSLANALAPIFDYADAVDSVLLPILIEDFHEYAKLLSAGSRGLALQATSFQNFAGSVLDRIDYLATAQVQSRRPPEPVYIVVTTRAVKRPDGRPAPAYTDLGELLQGIQPEHLSLSPGSPQGPWSEDEAARLLLAAKESVEGHAYLFDRFLRSATALRRANATQSVEEIVDAVRSLPQVWYQDRLFEPGVPLATRSEDDPTPSLHPVDYTPFLDSVARHARDEPGLLEKYRQILERDGGLLGDLAYDNAYLVPLLQLGLVKPDPAGTGYVPSCPIIERYFSPSSLGSLLGLGS